MKVIANAFKDKPELKKYMKKLMPFVQVAKVINVICWVTSKIWTNLEKFI